MPTERSVGCWSSPKSVYLATGATNPGPSGARGREVPSSEFPVFREEPLRSRSFASLRTTIGSLRTTLGTIRVRFAGFVQACW